MASEHYKCKEELSITDFEKGENEQIASETYFDAIPILKEEVKEEATEIKLFSEGGNEFDAIHIMQGEIVEADLIEIKPFSKYGVFNDYLEKNVDSFYDPDLSEFEVRQRNSVEDFKESTFSPIYSGESMVCNSLADELAKPQASHYNNGVIVKNEDECTEDSSRNSVESKMETFKTECDIDIIYEDVKPQICEEKSRGKNENESYINSNTDISIGTEVGPNNSIESGSRIHQDTVIKENETAVKKENDEMIIMNSKDCQMILSEGKLPHCKYDSQSNSFELKQEFNEITRRGEKTFQCNYCPNSFAEKKALSVHERIHTRKKSFQCKFCSKSFFRTRDLMGHESIHTGVKPFKCKICPKSFAVNKTLLRHEIIHTGEKPFQCKGCPMRFTEKAQLLRHTGKGPFQCQFCAKSFAYQGALTDHERIHTGEKPFECKICLKSFAAKRTLFGHERIHTGEKPFQCKICLKSFSHKGQMSGHQRIHTGEKPFQCKVCPKNFTNKSSLLVHERIHTGEKPFQCKTCLKSFFQKGHLTGHEKLHTGEKPFNCKVCLKSFTYKSSLLLHKRNHTGEKPFQCKSCSKSFTRKEYLMRHERIHIR